MANAFHISTLGIEWIHLGLVLRSFASYNLTSNSDCKLITLRGYDIMSLFCVLALMHTLSHFTHSNGKCKNSDKIRDKTANADFSEFHLISFVLCWRCLMPLNNTINTGKRKLLFANDDVRPFVCDLCRTIFRMST